MPARVTILLQVLNLEHLVTRCFMLLSVLASIARIGAERLLSLRFASIMLRRCSTPGLPVTSARSPSTQRVARPCRNSGLQLTAPGVLSPGWRH
jgi:hypothetical protein